MRQHIDCPLVVDPIRHRGAKHLVERHQCDVIICDDVIKRGQNKGKQETSILNFEKA